MTHKRIEVKYLSAGTNRYSSIADWHENGELGFGADANVCLWRPTDDAPRGIFKVLSGHTAHVRAVKFLPKSRDEDHVVLVSGGDDRSLLLWSIGPEASAKCIYAVAQAHTAAVNCLAAVQLPSDRGLRRIFASGGADSIVKLWAFEKADVKLLQNIETSRKFIPLAICMHTLGEDEGSLVMAVAGTTSVVHIFSTSLNETALELKNQATLSGHDNWIRSLAITRETLEPSSDLILASASQDKYIRLWRIHKGTPLTALKASLTDSTLASMSPGNKMHRLKAGAIDYTIIFEALLLGHEDWIYSARWCRSTSGRLRLLSASADNSLSIWEADSSSGMWLITARMGEVSREKGATTATGSIGGFWTGLWSPSGNTVATLGRTGSWRRWDYNAEQGGWIQNMSISGHTRAVTGLAWSRNGEFLLSTSLDQTTRLHAEWKAAAGRRTWHEMSRPQIHGYDLKCIDTLGNSSFVSGADEKLMRVFTKPKAVAKMLDRLTLTNTNDTSLDILPDAANMPVLGLSNKAINTIDDNSIEDLTIAPLGPNTDRDALDPAITVHKSALEMNHPPFEESLSRHTLFPEVEKLYGHGYEISCLATTRDGRLIASACKASSFNHAVIRIFETARWTEVKPPLAAHTLTVTRLRFSGDDLCLLSVGRDRQWALFKRRDGGDEFALWDSNTKAHTRMVLDAAWAPLQEGQSRVFATGGRDKQVKLWVARGAEDKFELARNVTNEHPVTALDFLAAPVESGRVLLAYGTDAGKLAVLLLKVEEGEVNIVSIIDFDPSLWLPKAVLQLSWRPTSTGRDGEGKDHDLAIAGDDGTLRIYTIFD